MMRKGALQARMHPLRMTRRALSQPRARHLEARPMEHGAIFSEHGVRPMEHGVRPMEQV